MAENPMLKFVGKEQAYPEKRGADARAEDFLEISKSFILDKAEEQASRCSQCGVPYCSTHCPLHNHIPDWLRLTAEGRLREAYELSNLTSTMPEICGRICPQDRLCEGNCVIEFSGHGSVTIGSVEKFITDTAWKEGWVEPLVPGAARGQSVGVIGAGPAGLTTAEYLRVAGYEVHVYDRHDRAGGLLTYGIPGFKLEKDVVMRRVQRLKDGGIIFHEGFEVGRDASMEQLRAKHDAILIATGVYKARDIKAPGVGAPGVVKALDYLTASNKAGFGDAVPGHEDGTLLATGKNVVVIGGGDTAMDCVRTAIRQGAKSVKCLYRRDRDNMPGSQREVANAEEEGVEFVWLTAPIAFEGTEHVTGVKVTKMRLGSPDASGRRAPEPDPGSEFRLDADIVIKALGFDAEIGCRDGFAGERLRRTLQHDAALAQAQHAVGESHGARQVLLHQQQAGAAGLAQVGEVAVDLFHRQRRQAQRHLVKQQHVGVGHERAADGGGLALSAGERAGRPVDDGRQSGQRLQHPGQRPLAGAAMIARHAQVFAHAHVVKQAPALGHHGQAAPHALVGQQRGDVLAGERHTPRRGGVHARQAAQQRGLARAVGPHQGQDVALVHLQRHIAHSGQLAVVGVQVVNTQQHAHAATPPR